MITRLCEKVSKITKAPITFNVFSKGPYRYSARVGEIRSFVSKLDKNDLELFKRRATFSIENFDIDQRSTIIPLEQPIDIDGRKILALRLKGVFPVSDEKGDVSPYTEGKGFSDLLLRVPGKDRIGAVLRNEAKEYAALGSMKAERLETEVWSALKIGPELTDLTIGFGLFEDLHFNDGEVGFVVYGMEREKDVRILQHLTDELKNSEDMPRLNSLAENTGLILRLVHEMKLLHGRPHLNNYAFVDQKRSRIVDLDTVADISSIPKEERAAFLYLALSRTINDFMKQLTVKIVHDGELETIEGDMIVMLPSFLWGYFKGDEALPLLREIKRAKENDLAPWEANKIFGSLPNFGLGWRSGGDKRTLVEPIVELYASGGMKTVDLKNCQDNDLFNLFYQALESVAGSI